MRPTTTGEKAQRLDADTNDTIRKAQNLRNKVAHAGRATVPHDSLTTTLQTVRRILWGLDVNRGFAWAANTYDDDYGD